MSDQIDAGGGAITAGLIGAAIEGGGKRKPGNGEACSNCATPVHGYYCSNCGQPAHIHRSILHMLEEVLHGVVHFDTKFWRTLPRLVARPGMLTHEYVHGMRARYVSPMAFFLFTVFLMFFVFSFLEGSATKSGVINVGAPEDRAVAMAEISLESAEQAVSSRRERVWELRDGLAAARESADARATQRLQAEISREEAELAGREAALSQARTQLEAAEAKRADMLKQGARATADTRDAAKTPADAIDLSGEKSWEQQWVEAIDCGDITVSFGNEALNKKILKKLRNPDLIVYKLQQTAYKFSFLLIPLSVPFVAMLFLWRRGTTWFDHAVFVLYSVSFMSMLVLVVFSLAVLTQNNPIPSLLLLCAPLHMFFQVKGAYTLGWFSALWRTAALLLFAVLALAMFVIAILVLGLTG